MSVCRIFSMRLIDISIIISADSCSGLPAPSWVNVLPTKTGHLYAVGVVNQHYEVKAGEEAARTAAQYELAQSIKVNIKTIAGSWEGTTSGKGFTTSLEKSVDDDVLQYVQSAKIIEFWTDPQGLVYALAELPLAGIVSTLESKVLDAAKDSGSKSKLKKLRKKLKNLSDPQSYVRKDKPDWVDILPEEGSALYAVGIAERYYFYVNGREAAKDKARAELAATVQSEVQSVLTDWFEVNEGTEAYLKERSFFEEMTKSVSEASLAGSQIIETWFNRTTKWHYALARLDLNSLFNDIKTKAGSKVKGKKAIASLDKYLSKLIDRSYLLMEKGQPVWVSKMPKVKGALFAVGIDDGRYFDQTQGLEKCKLDARKNLAKSIEVQVQNITSSWLEIKETQDALSNEPLNDYLKEITHEASNVSLEGSQIVTTFVKKKDGQETYYALARIYSGGLLKKLRAKARQVLKVPEAPDSADTKAEKIIAGPRKKAMEALKKLDAALEKLD